MFLLIQRHSVEVSILFPTGNAKKKFVILCVHPLQGVPLQVVTSLTL
jgi:hypothetical protein